MKSLVLILERTWQLAWMFYFLRIVCFAYKGFHFLVNFDCRKGGRPSARRGEDMSGIECFETENKCAVHLTQQSGGIKHTRMHENGHKLKKKNTCNKDEQISVKKSSFALIYDKKKHICMHLGNEKSSMKRSIWIWWAHRERWNASVCSDLAQCKQPVHLCARLPPLKLLSISLWCPFLLFQTFVPPASMDAVPPQDFKQSRRDRPAATCSSHRPAVLIVMLQRLWSPLKASHTPKREMTSVIVLLSPLRRKMKLFFRFTQHMFMTLSHVILIIHRAL